MNNSSTDNLVKAMEGENTKKRCSPDWLVRFLLVCNLALLGALCYGAFRIHKTLTVNTEKMEWWKIDDMMTLMNQQLIYKPCTPVPCIPSTPTDLQGTVAIHDTDNWRNEKWSIGTSKPKTYSIVLHSDAFNAGIKIQVDLVEEQCHDLPEGFDNVTSSVTTNGNCVMLCDDHDCEGRCEKMTDKAAGVTWFGDIDFNDMVSSLKLCSHSDDNEDMGKRFTLFPKYIS